MTDDRYYAIIAHVWLAASFVGRGPAAFACFCLGCAFGCVALR